MELEKVKSIIESILFSAGRDVKIGEFVSILELAPDEIIGIIESIRAEYLQRESGIEIIKIEDGFMMCTKKENYEYIYPIFDKRNKPNLSNAALETLSIVAYNPKVTRAEIEMIRGVNSDGTIYKLLEYNLIEEAGKLDMPGRPTAFQITNEFLKLFGYTSLEDLPELPRYKLDENEQIVIDDIIEEKKEDMGNFEAPMPEREKDIELDNKQ